VRNLAPRGGWQHDLVDALGGLQPLSAQQRSLPLAQVQLACFDTLHAVTAPQPSLNPRFEKNSCRFENITLGNAISIKVCDRPSLIRRQRPVLGEAELLVEKVPSTCPIYVWVPLHLPRERITKAARAAAKAGAMAGEPWSAVNTQGPSLAARQRQQVSMMFGGMGVDAAVQVFLRLQISRPPASGLRVGLTLDLAGIGVCARTSMSELFNFTVQRVRASMLQTVRDLQLTAAINAVQLDNQLLETLRPVVLSPSDVSSTSISGQ
ncbi:uncharacterized protein HaLaN_07607, partial [Haematococcus lacustris]